MYVPAVYAESDLATLHAFIEAHSFGLLCSVDGGAPFASHLPFLLERPAGPLGTLTGHMARANPQWWHADGKPVLAVFSGPHAYVSPAWYEAEQVVPTWNYVAVHAAGTFRAVHDPAALRQILDASVAFFEQARPAPWRLEGPPEFIDRMVRGIVGFRVEVERIEGKWKLSQNQPPERRARVVRGLRAEGGADGEAIAMLMQRRGG
jgi:transcriptional regulator